MVHMRMLHALDPYHLYYVDSLFSVAVVVVSVDDDEDDGYFGQEQVPLTDEIREILEEYPDGQIFKVCEWRLIMFKRVANGKWKN